MSIRNTFAPAMLLLALAACLGFHDAEARSRRDIETAIRMEASEKVDLAVGLFDANVAMSDVGLAREMRAVLFADLEFSNFFNLIDVSRHTDDLVPGFEEKTPLDFDRYYLIGTKGLALAKLERMDDDRIALTGRLYDARAGEMVFGKVYEGPRSGWREMIHRFADEIVERFTGGKGVATTELLYISNATGNKEVYRMDYDGGRQRPVTSNGSINLSAQWNPSMSGFAFTSYIDGRPEIFFYDFSLGAERKMVAFPGINSSPAYSADGKKLAVTLSKDGNSEIYVGNADGTELRRLTFDPSIDTSPAWSPNGRQLVFVSDRSGKPQLYVMDAEGLNTRRLTFDGYTNDEPQWSPNGSLIAFSSQRWGATDICLTDVVGSSIKVLTDSKSFSEAPTFAPNGFHIAYSSNATGKFHIYTMDLDGSDKRRLTFGTAQYVQPAWSSK